MTGVSPEWLALREPFDLRARNLNVLNGVTASFKQLPSMRIVDLACGAGSTLRALSPQFATQQNWRLADNDLGLLARAAAMPLSKNVAVNTLALDLNRDLESALDGPVDLVTTSALLDLVSEHWLDRLAVEIAARSIPFYAALSFDGRIELAPRDPLDADIVVAVNAHQQTDKGFGPALGPAAAAFAIARFEGLGYSVIHGTSDWIIGPDDRDMQFEVLAGWASAARDTGEMPIGDTANWLSRRRGAVTAGRSSTRVGHVDFFAAPMRTR